MAIQLKTITYNNTKIASIFKKHPTLPIFNLQLVFKNSGYINDKNISGITSLLAKMLNNGNKKDGASKFHENLENNAIEINFQTGFETFVIEISCLKENYKIALKYLNKVLENPNFTKKTLDKAKNEQINTLIQKENDFDFIASSSLKQNIYKNTALQYTSLGSIEDIKKINLIDIKNKMSSIFNINKLIIVSGGDLSFEDLETNIKKTLSILKKEKYKDIKKIKFNSKTNENIIKKDTQQSYIYFASKFNIDVNSSDNYKSKIASFILGSSGFGSRLMEEIRVKNGLAYSVYAYFVNKKSHSHFTGYLQTKIENTQKAKDLLKNIINDFSKKGVTLEELESAKKFLLGSQVLRTETFSQQLSQAFDLYYKGLPFDYYKKESNLIQNLSLDSLNDFIKSHSEINDLSFSIVTK